MNVQFGNIQLAEVLKYYSEHAVSYVVFTKYRDYLLTHF